MGARADANHRDAVQQWPPRWSSVAVRLARGGSEVSPVKRSTVIERARRDPLVTVPGDRHHAARLSGDDRLAHR